MILDRETVEEILGEHDLRQKDMTVEDILGDPGSLTGRLGLPEYR